MSQKINHNNPIFKFEIVSLKDEIELVTEILYDAIVNNSQFNGMLYQKYPKLINAIDINMDINQVREHVTIAISESYKDNIKEILQKIDQFEKNWIIVKNDLLKQLKVDMESGFKVGSIITVKVGNAPLCPRWIDELSFYVPSYIYNFNLIAIHECCHFLFFYKYELLFGKCKKEEYDYPSDLWLLSEVLIDPILNNEFYINIIGEEIKSYDYLYEIMVGNKNLIECIREILKEEPKPERYISKCMQLIKNNSTYND